MLRPHRRRLVLALLSLAVGSTASLVYPLIIVQLLAALTNSGGPEQLNQAALGLGLIFLIRALASFSQDFHLVRIGEQVIRDLRLALYDHLQHLSLGFFADRQVGELISRFATDVVMVRSILTYDISALLSYLVSLFGSLLVLTVLNYRLALVVILLMPGVVILSRLVGRTFQSLSTQLQDATATATAVVSEGLQGIRVVKSFAREPFEMGRYRSAVGRAYTAAIRLTSVRLLFGAAMSFLSLFTIVLILWFAGQEVIAGRLALPAVGGFMIYGLTISGNLSGLAGLYGQFREALGAAQRVFDLLDTPPDVVDEPDAGHLPRVEGRISFEGVSFGYEAQVDVLRDFSLDIAPGEIVALVGPSGAGKTTVFNLIPRFYDPAEGVVCIDGIDLRTVTQRSIREQIGVVPQETLLFSGTIRENIRYGRLDADEAAIIEAARSANAHEFIMGFPAGYDTRVGERGVKLSGGQRQRVAIARAILKDPRILLLDEATSSLDSESEELVQQALRRLMYGRTTVIIAHRLSTVRIAHRIVVLDQGRIVEQGAHEALLDANGLYARWFRLQFALG